MLNISYTISPRLNDYLFKIENLRRIILLTPIPQETKIKLRWEATLDRIYAYLFLSGNDLRRMELAKLLNQSKEILKIKIPKIVHYKSALDYIIQNWLGSSNPIDAETIVALSKLIRSNKLSAPKEELHYLLEYLSAKQENPVIQAAIAYIEFIKMQPFKNNNQAIALLTSTLFLFKYGYDFRGFLAYENEWVQDNSYFTENHKLAMNTPTLTLWLEYFALSILNQLEKLEQTISKPNSISGDFPRALLELNDRQKSILSNLDKPDSVITNKKIQKRYKISQVTASRDLRKLANLNLLFTHGKGRSVYYTKV